MIQPVLLDTGPLVALLNRRDAHHDWTRTQFDRITPPLLTCEAVLSEACFLLGRAGQGAQSVLELLNRGVVSLRFHLTEESEAVAELMTRYANVPMSLADACLVRMAELFPRSVLLALDSDFLIYRKHRRSSIRTLMP